MTTLADLDGTRWKGTNELWLDPLGDQALRSEGTLHVAGNVVSYTWSHEGKAHRGSFTLTEGGADFVDTWHQAQPTRCRSVADGRGLFHVQYAYGPQGDWGWRAGLFLRAPTGELVLQMTNVTPWGEESRAVRMVCTKVE